MTDHQPDSWVQWQYYRVFFSVPPTQERLDKWGWDKPEGWWAADSKQEALDCARANGDGTIRSRTVHMTYDEWVEEKDPWLTQL